MKKMWYIYTVEYYSAIKKEPKNAICSNVGGPRDYDTNWTKSKTNTIYYHLHVEYKMDTNELFTK